MERKSVSSDLPIVFDVGMNVGGNIPYYLEKGYRVVGIDANPQLVDDVKQKFAEEVADGRLVAVNVGVGAEDGVLPFYINKRQSGLSSFAPPTDAGEEWTSLDVPVRPLSSLIAEFGAPEFIKVDVEGFDAVVLRDLLSHNICPPSLSVEVQSIESVATLIALGYTEFQLINAAKIGHSGVADKVTHVDGSVSYYEFADDAAGPFGEDLTGQWVSAMEAVIQWYGKRVFLGVGWYDMHGRKPAGDGIDTRGIEDEAKVADAARFALRELVRSGRERVGGRVRR